MLVDLIRLYDQFLSLFPTGFGFLISLIIIIALGLFLLILIRRNLWWILLLLLLFPALIPAFRKVLLTIFEFLLSWLR